MIQPVNALGSLMGGIQAREAVTGLRNRNALSGAVQEFGPTSPQALNALAQADPAAAMDYGLRREAAGAEASGERTKRYGAALLAIDSLPPEAQGQAYAQLYSQAQQDGANLESVPSPDQYQPGLAGMLGAYLSGQQPPAPSAFETETAGLSPEEVMQARRIKAGVAARVEAPKADVPASVREFQFAREQGYTGSYSDFLGTKAPGTTVNVNGPNVDKFSEETGKVLAQEAAEVAKAGQAAQGNLRSLDRLDELLTAAPSGANASLRQFLGEFGIETQGLSDIQAAQALINKLVPEQRPPGTGPMSDADLALFKQSLPRIINTKDGNKAIIETLKKIAAYDVQRGQIARQLQLGQISPNEADAAWNALSNPLADFASGKRGPGTPIGGFDKIPQGIEPEEWEYMNPEERARVNELMGGQGTPNPSKPAEKAGPAAFMGGDRPSTPLTLARAFVGVNEKETGPALRAFFRRVGGQNIDPQTTAWCAAFVNTVLSMEGQEGTGDLSARSFLNWGKPVEKPSDGDVVVLWRESPDSWKGHVGFYAGRTEDGDIRVVGGNQDNGVNEKVYPASRVLGYRRGSTA